MLALFIFCLMQKIKMTEAVVYRNDNLRIANFNDIHKGKSLDNHVIKTTQVSSEMDCVLECLNVDLCVSYNYQDNSSTNSHICELNNNTYEHSKMQDFKARDGFSYAQSILKTRTDGPCATIPCQNNGTCLKLDYGLYECVCHWSKSGDYCEKWKDNANDYMLNFPQKSTNDFVSAVALKKSQVTDITMCVWVQYTVSFWMSLFSYISNDSAVKLFLRCRDIGTCRIVIERTSRVVYTGRLQNGEWHHICFSWTNKGGIIKFYVDGALRGSKKEVSTGLVIDGTGKLILGQLYKSSQTFWPSHALKGNLHGFNMWDSVKPPSEIFSLSKQCTCDPGNLVDWRVFSVTETKGLVRKVIPSKCKFNRSMIAVYQSSNGNKYIKTSFTASLQQLTACFWSRRISKYKNTAFSYFTEAGGKSLEWTFHSMMNFIVTTATYKTKLTSSSHCDDSWHHFCYTWDSASGLFVVFIDGIIVFNTSAAATGETIQGNGVLVVGQDITSINPLVVSTNSFYLGYLTDFNLWNSLLTGFLISAMSKAAGRDDGTALSWNEIIYSSEVVGGLSFTPYKGNETTNASKSNFYLDFGSSQSTSNYVKFQNPIPEVNKFLACVWVWAYKASAIFSYSIPSEPDEWDTYIYPNKAAFAIHGHWIYPSAVNTFDDGWTFICWRWQNGDGKTELFKDGQLLHSLTNYKKDYVIPGNGHFILGQDMDSHGGGFATHQAYTGYLGHLNIWSHFSSYNSISKMSRGVQATFEGNIVPWSIFRTGIYGAVIIVENSPCTLPDFSSTELRNKWCKYYVTPRSSCTLISHFDQNTHNNGKRLRCYCSNILYLNSSGYFYPYGSRDTDYHTREGQLRVINAG